jgi:hexokinase
VVKFDEAGVPTVSDFTVYPMPGTKGELSREEFFDTIAAYLLPVYDRSDRIGFCFSFPTEILPCVDGRILNLNKEVRVRGISGAVIGENLAKSFAKMGRPGPKKLAVLNDTAAALLCGMTSSGGRLYGGYVGFILGTGTNTCYIERNGRIRKAPTLLSKPGCTLVNLESGGYGKAPRGLMDERMDAKTATPGDHKLEKMVSGAYQGALMMEILRQGALDGLFSPDFCRRLDQIGSLAAKELDEFCDFPSGDNTLAVCAQDERDRLTVFYLIDAISERTARLVSINLGAVLTKTGSGANPRFPACVCAEGTTFYKSRLFRKKLDYCVRTELNDRMGLYCEFVKRENATLTGTAAAGLSV